MDLTDFLFARIAEEEANPPDVSKWAAYVDGLSSQDWERIDAEQARWDTRWQADLAAKRRIVDEHETIAAAYPGTTIESDPCCETCSAGGEYPGRYPCKTLRLLALPYADHPDYDKGWRP